MDNKKRIVEVLDYLKENTNSEHTINTEKIINYLESKGYKAERKTIYSDVKALSELGYYVEKKYDGYYYDGEMFDAAEIRVLIDMVKASDFLTDKRTQNINKKLLKLLNTYDRAIADDGQYESTKTGNELVFVNIDKIMRAINDKQAIRFKYFDMDINGEKKYRLNHNYDTYPYALVINDNRYYMVGLSLKYNEPINYRIDKMDEVKTIKQYYEKEDFDVNKYMSKTFNMFNGELKNIDLKCDKHDNRLAMELRMKFGKDLLVTVDGPDYFVCNVNVAVSPNFFSWLFNYENKITILGPQEVIDEYVSISKRIVEKYK